jgi:hypothetical protein
MSALRGHSRYRVLWTQQITVTTPSTSDNTKISEALLNTLPTPHKHAKVRYCEWLRYALWGSESPAS